MAGSRRRPEAPPNSGLDLGHCLLVKYYLGSRDTILAGIAPADLSPSWCAKAQQRYVPTGKWFNAPRPPLVFFAGPPRSSGAAPSLIWLIPALLLSFGFGQLFKHAQRRGCYAPAVVSANYVTIAVLLLVYHLATGQLQPAPQALEVGAFIGLFFILAMLLMTRGLELATVGAVLTSFRLAILIPIWASVWLWGETLTPVQLGGIALSLMALVLMTRGGTSSQRLSPLHSLGLLVLIFVGQGIAFCGMRWVHYAGLDARFLQVLLFITLTAGVLGCVFILCQGRRPRRQDLLMGLGIGLYNLLALSVNLIALSKVPGTLYFPLQGCAVVLLDNLCAQFWWKEPLSRPAMAGVALGVLSIILVL